MKYLTLLAIAVLGLFTACSTDDNDELLEVNEVEDLLKVQDIATDLHTIELYTKNGNFVTGYNEISVRIKSNATGDFVKDAAISWNPVMQMPTMQHSCPKSAFAKTEGTETVYNAFVVYQMTNTDGSGWSLTFNTTIDGQEFSVTEEIVVEQSALQRVTSFMGSNDKRYVAALMGPQDPVIGVNELKVGLFTMENMMSFPVAQDHFITLDPRMPGMGNHSSPNNSDLTYTAEELAYFGDLSLTMSGYWVLNLRLFDAQETLLKGEEVTEEQTQSSFYLELEF